MTAWEDLANVFEVPLVGFAVMAAALMVTANGSAVTAAARAVPADGPAVVATVADGRITRIDEYLDSAHVARITG